MAMSFLAEYWGFSGPELTADGVAYNLVGLHVEMGCWASAVSRRRWRRSALTGPNGGPNLSSCMRRAAPS
jgi:hypothetical protein